MKRKMKRFAEGGVGYEEDPKPGQQGSEEPRNPGLQSSPPTRKQTKTVTRKTLPRKVSSMEFIQEYESAAPSSRMQKEAESAVRRSRSNLPGDRATGYSDKGKSPYVDLDEKRAKEALEDTANAVATAGFGAEMAGAKLGLRAKQMLRRMQTARANAAERAVDKAGEAARRGMSRRDLPRYDERYRASEAAASARGMSGGGSVKKYAKGGFIKSSASRRADGIAKKGKTRGKIV
jgi:hypothetical protein